VITVIGLLGGFFLVITAMMMGGSVFAFIDSAAILIVLGGTTAITAVSFSVDELKAAPKTLWQMLSHRQLDPRDAGEVMLRLAERARRDGILDLEQATRAVSDDPFLHRAMRLIVDGTSSEDAESILKTETYAISTMQMNSINILRRAAEVSPAMGLIGTLVGLVKMLGNLDDPATIGPAMAIALLTTFYGAMLAHMIFIPLASRAERTAKDEVLLNSVYTLGAAAIGRKDNPRRIETLINTILPPTKRIEYFR